MKDKKQPKTHITISNKTGRSINSIVRISNLKEFYIQSFPFLKSFAELLNDLPWEKSATEENTLRKHESIIFETCLKGLRLSLSKKKENNLPNDYFFKKEFIAKPIHHLLGSIFFQYYKFIQNELPKNFAKIKIHFIREKVLKGLIKNIVSEVPIYERSIIILNQENISGGESQILEKKDDGSFEIIFQQKLNAGDFVFLKTKNGNLQNIYHQLTPIKLENETKKIGWLDFMRFEIIE